MRNGTVALQFQVDGTGNPVLDASENQIPLTENYVQEIGSLFDIWHNLDKLEVLLSCQINFQHSEDVVVIPANALICSTLTLHVYCLL